MSEIEAALDFVLETAQRLELEIEVLAQEKESTGISFSQGQLEQFSFSETGQLGVRVIQGQDEGVAYTESLEHESLENTIDGAQANARLIYREWLAELNPGGDLPRLEGIYNPALDDIPVETKIQAAQALESQALAFDPRIANVPGSRYGDASAQMWIANSKGLRGTYRVNACHVYARCLARDGSGAVMAGDVAAGRGFEQLDPNRVAIRAAEKTLQRLGALRPETGRYTVVFENRVAESLIGLLADYFSAKDIDENTSPLTGKLGQKLFSMALTIVDDPFFVSGSGCRPFDDEGYASRRTTLVEDGRVNAFLTNSVLARKLKLAHTASASRAPSTELDVSTSNVVVAPGTHELADLLGADPRVILVTDVMGFAGFRAASGDFSIPVEGQLYENGKRVTALKDFLISGNLLQLFAAIEAIGNDQLAPVGSIVCPSLLVRDLNVAGQS